MPVLEYTPIISRTGKVVHAVSLALRPMKTACGKSFSKGWRVALRRLSCKECKLAVGLDARGKKARK